MDPLRKRIDAIRRLIIDMLDEHVGVFLIDMPSFVYNECITPKIDCSGSYELCVENEDEKYFLLNSDTYSDELWTVIDFDELLFNLAHAGARLYECDDGMDSRCHITCSNMDADEIEPL